MALVTLEGMVFNPMGCMRPSGLVLMKKSKVVALNISSTHGMQVIGPLGMNLSVKMFVSVKTIRLRYNIDRFYNMYVYRTYFSHYNALRVAAVTAFGDCKLNNIMMHQRLNVGTFTKKNLNFQEWLVGIVDGEGCFNITQKKGKLNTWQFSLKIGQQDINYRVLYYIKQNIGYGSITKDGANSLQYSICDTIILKDVIFPIFDKYPLHSYKQYRYELFKRAVLNPKDRQSIKELFNADIPKEYKSPHNSIPSKSWIIGFIEAKGSFYLTLKKDGHIVHGFGVTQKLDSHLLEQLRIVLGISTKVKLNSTNNCFMLNTTNSRAIENIISYFKNSLIGIKSVDYRIWSRSYIKHKGDFERLSKISRLMKNLRYGFDI